MDRRAAAAIAAALAFVAAAASPRTAWAHHGPGFSAVGRSVPGGAMLERGRVSFTLRYEQTEFENLAADASVARARAGGSFEWMERALLVSPTLGFGLSRRVDLSASIGYFRAVDARESVHDALAGETAHFRFDPDGFTDLWLNAKFAVAGGERHRLAIHAGLKAPTGRRTVDVTSDGETTDPAPAKSAAFSHEVEAAPLPIGSGAWDGLLGVGYSMQPSERMTLDVGGHFVLRTKADDIRLGNRLDAGVLAAYALSPHEARFPHATLLGEAVVQSIAANRVEGERDPNSGGTTLFVSPGLRLDIVSGATLWMAPQFPVVQEVNGEQAEARFRFVTEITSLF